MIDNVDFRVVKTGRTGFESLTEGDAVLSETDGACAGDAGIVLSRFFEISAPSAPGIAFVELGGGRDVRVAPKAAADLAVAA